MRSGRRWEAGQRGGRRLFRLSRSCLCCAFVYGLQASGEVPRQELLDTVDGMIGDVGQHMSQIGLRIEAVELGRTDEGVEDGGTFSSALGAGEGIVATHNATPARSAVGR